MQNPTKSKRRRTLFILLIFVSLSVLGLALLGTDFVSIFASSPSSSSSSFQQSSGFSTTNVNWFDAQNRKDASFEQDEEIVGSTQDGSPNSLLIPFLHQQRHHRHHHHPKEEEEEERQKEEQEEKKPCKKFIIGIFSTRDSYFQHEYQFRKWLPVIHFNPQNPQLQPHQRKLSCGLNFVFVYGKPGPTSSYVSSSVSDSSPLSSYVASYFENENEEELSRKEQIDYRSPSSSSSSEEDDDESSSTSPLFPSSGRVILNIPENMNDGKSFTWFSEASNLYFKDDADYIFKMDADVGFCPTTLHQTLLRAAELNAEYVGWPMSYWSCGNFSYCPPPSRFLTTAPADTAKNNKKKKKKKPQQQQLRKFWTYMSGGFYGLSCELAKIITSSSYSSSSSSSGSADGLENEKRMSGIEDLLMGQMIRRHGILENKRNTLNNHHHRNDHLMIIEKQKQKYHSKKKNNKKKKVNRYESNNNNNENENEDKNDENKRLQLFALECMMKRDPFTGQSIVEPSSPSCPVKHFASFHRLKKVPSFGIMCDSSESSFDYSFTTHASQKNDDEPKYADPNHIEQTHEHATASTITSSGEEHKEEEEEEGEESGILKHKKESSSKVKFSSYLVQVKTMGRLGNQFFQWASAFGIATKFRGLNGLTCIVADKKNKRKNNNKEKNDQEEQEEEENLLSKHFVGPFSICPHQEEQEEETTEGKEKHEDRAPDENQKQILKIQKEEPLYIADETGYGKAAKHLLEAPFRFPTNRIQVMSFLQSFKYFDHAREKIKNAFQIRDQDVVRRADSFISSLLLVPSSETEGEQQREEAESEALQEKTKSNNNNGVCREIEIVGIHVRRGDHVHVQNYLRFPPNSYFEDAIEFFQQKQIESENAAASSSSSCAIEYVFVVASDDPDWCRQQDFFSFSSSSSSSFKNERNRPRMILLADSHLFPSSSSSSSSPPSSHEKNSEKETVWLTEFAVLCRCDHIIMTLGSFGWWSGFLVSTPSSSSSSPTYHHNRHLHLDTSNSESMKSETRRRRRKGGGERTSKKTTRRSQQNKVIYYRDMFDLGHPVNAGKVKVSDHFPSEWVGVDGRNKLRRRVLTIIVSLVSVALLLVVGSRIYFFFFTNNNNNINIVNKAFK